MAIRGLFPIAESESVPAHLGSRAFVKARDTGEFRKPRKGEWYLSGAITEAYQAVNDMISPYNIAVLVPIRQAPEEFNNLPVVGAIKLPDDPSEMPSRWLVITAGVKRNQTQYNTIRIAWNVDMANWVGTGGRYGLTWKQACSDLGERASQFPEP